MDRAFNNLAVKRLAFWMLQSRSFIRSTITREEMARMVQDCVQQARIELRLADTHISAELNSATTIQDLELGD